MRTPITMQPLTPDLRAAMDAASERDHGHYAPLASHVFTRNSEVLGAAAICAPIIFFWARTDLPARDSLELVAKTRSLADAAHPAHLCACTQESPFFPLMGHLGYNRIGYADIFKRQGA